MPPMLPIAALNRTRGTCLAEDVRVARNYWTRLRGLVGTNKSAFTAGQALWIVPSRGVHTLAMSFPLDLIYLDSVSTVVHLQESVKPWRFAAVAMGAASVLELPPGTIQKSATHVGDKIEIVAANHPEEKAA